MLRASAKEDAIIPQKGKKPAIMIDHLVKLARKLCTGGPKEKAVLDLALVAFWGLARLGEITYLSRSGVPNPRREVHAADVAFKETSDGKIKGTITLRNAKTAKPGKPQKLLLQQVDNLLCPVGALRRRQEEARGPADSLFGYYETDGTQTNLT
jgi:hypothetical protein